MPFYYFENSDLVHGKCLIILIWSSCKYTTLDTQNSNCSWKPEWKISQIVLLLFHVFLVFSTFFQTRPALDGSIVSINCKLLFCWRPTIFPSNQPNKKFSKIKKCAPRKDLCWTGVLIELIIRGSTCFICVSILVPRFLLVIGIKFFIVFSKLIKQAFYLEPFVKIASHNIFQQQLFTRTSRRT